MERMLEKIKMEKKDELETIRKIGHRSEVDMKKEVKELSSANEDLTKMNHHLLKERNELNSHCELLVKERNALLAEQSKWKMDSKGFALLSKAHHEIERQVKLLESMRKNVSDIDLAVGRGGSSPTKSRFSDFEKFMAAKKEPMTAAGKRRTTTGKSKPNSR